MSMLSDMLNVAIFESQLFEILMILSCGLVFGSFASALTYRVPRNLPWVTKGKSEHGLRSACPACKTLLGFRDLIPLFSWLLSKGKCRHCKIPISKTYPICEILTVLGFVGIYAVYGLTWFSLPFLMMIPFLTALIMIDFKHMILPNQLVAIIFGLGAVTLILRMLSINDPNIAQILITYIGGAVIFCAFSWFLGVIMKKAMKKDALGFGDIKFFAAAGLWLGLPMIGYFCIGAGAIGIVMGLIWQKATGSAAFPFGPALILSFYTLLLLQGSHFL